MTNQTDVSSLQEVIDRDKKRHEYRKDVIKMIDEHHKALLSKIKDAPLEFHRLEELLRKRNKDKKDTAARKELEAGHQAYFVYPAIDSDENIKSKN